MKKRKYFDSVIKELRDRLEKKTIAFDDLMAMLVNAYDAGLIDGVDMAFNELKPMSERHSAEAFDAALDVPKIVGKAHVEEYLNKPGGYRDKAKEVLRAWRSGSYKTKHECAENISKEIGVSYDTARRHLREKKGDR